MYGFRSACLALLLALPACDAAEGQPTGADEALRIEVNEALTISHLKSLRGAEIQFQALGVLDEDGDGRGEFGFLGELSGVTPLRGPGEGLRFPLVADDFRRLTPTGIVKLHGYLYRFYLPDAAGAPVGEGAADHLARVDPDSAEESWIAWAWPAEYGETGRRSFFLSAAGTIHAAERPDLDPATGPDALEALAGGTTIDADVDPAWPEVE